jgi:hypothetical protein
MPRLVCLICLGILCLVPAAAQSSSNHDMESDLVIGYNFLFNTNDNEYYRNHEDRSEGFLVDSYHFSLSNRDDSQWFDKLTVNMSLANRIDAGKGVEVRFLKHGKFSASLKYSYYYDYFNDPEYNYGQNRRNPNRDNLRFDFDWKSVKDFVFSFGYRQNRVRGEFDYPAFYWGDSFAIPLDKNNDYQEVSGAVAYARGGFNASFKQAMIWFKDRSKYMPVEDMPGAGLGGLPVDMQNPARSGLVESSIPASTVTAGYRADNWSANFSYEYRNGSLDNNVLDLKTFYFTSAESRNDIMLKAVGTADLPEQKANFRADVDLFRILNLEYNFDWHTLETDSTNGLEDTLTLYPLAGGPMVMSQAYTDRFYYKNEYQTHSFTASVRPVKELLVSAAYRRTDGDMTKTFARDDGPDPGFLEDYSRDVYEFRGRYRFSFGSELSAAYIHEDIDHPVYLVAGQEKNDWQVSLYQPFTDKLSGQFTYRDAKLTDERIALDNRTLMTDASVQYLLMEDASIGLGYTRFHLDYSQDFDYYYNDNPVTALENFNTAQNGVYTFANFEGSERVKGHLSLYYLWDRRDAMPFHRWVGDASIEVGLTKGVSALFSARQFTYSEEIPSIHNYNVNEVTLALRWLIR